MGSKTFTIGRYGGESELCEWSIEKNVCFRSSVFYAFIQFFVVACSLPKTIIPLIYCCITLLPYQTINIIHILWRWGRRKRWCSGMYVTPTLREVWGYIKYNLIYVYELTQDDVRLVFPTKWKIELMYLFGNWYLNIYPCNSFSCTVKFLIIDFLCLNNSDSCIRFKFCFGCLVYFVF